MFGSFRLFADFRLFAEWLEDSPTPEPTGGYLTDPYRAVILSQGADPYSAVIVEG